MSNTPSLGKAFQEEKQTSARARRSRREASQTEQSQDTNIEQNVFFQILSNPDLSNAEKQGLVTKALTYDTEQTTEENQERLGMMSQYDEFLQAVRTQLASEQTELTRSNVYNDLQVTLESVNDEYKTFEQLLRPLAQALESIQELRQQGRAVDAYNEARELKQKEEEHRDELSEKQQRYSELEGEIRSLMSQITDTREGSSLPMWMRPGAKADIAGFEGKIAETRDVLTRVKEEIDQARNDHQALVAQLESDPNKKAIRNLVDISSDAYRDTQSKLVDHAHSFIDFSKTNLRTILSRLEQTGDQINALINNNTNLLEMYTILVAGMQGAEETNTGTLEKLEQELEGAETGGVEFLKRERQKINVESFMGDLQHLTRGATQTQGQVQGQAAFLVNQSRQNSTAVARTKSLRSEGIATVADRIAIVLTTINNAASREQAEIVGDTFRQAREMSAQILRNQFRDSAFDVRDENNRITDLIDQLGDLHSDLVDTTGDMRDGLREAKQLYAEAGKAIEDVKNAVGEFEAVDSEILREGPAEASAATRQGGTAPGGDALQKLGFSRQP